MIRARRTPFLLVAAGLFVAGCGSDGGGGSHDVEATVLESVAGDVGVCVETAGSPMTVNGNTAGWVGNIEWNNVAFLAGQCRVVLLFDQADASAIPEGTLLDSIQLSLSITSASANAPTGSIVIQSIQWTGDQAAAFSATDQSIAPVSFTPAVGAFTLNAEGIPPVSGTGGLIAYRLRMQVPNPLGGATRVWNLAMDEAGTATSAKLTYFWTH